MLIQLNVYNSFLIDLTIQGCCFSVFYSNGHEHEISLKHYSKTMEIFLIPVAEILQLICILWLNHLLAETSRANGSEIK